MDKHARDKREEQVRLVKSNHTYRYDGEVIPVVRVDVSRRSDFLNMKVHH